MSAFKTRRAKLLPFVLLIAVLLLWQPWSGVEPVLRGVRMGVDVAGGSQMMFELYASRVTVQVASDNQENNVNNVAATLETGLEVSVRLVSYDHSTKQAVFDVGRYLTEPVVQKALSGLGTVVNISAHLERAEMEKAISSLRARFDPYDVLGVQIRSFGESSIIFEASGMDPNRARDILGKQGKLEIFLDNQAVLSNDDIESVTAPMAVDSVAYVPVSLTKSGTELLRRASSGKADHPLTIYLDRPSDAILVFDNNILKNSTELFYDERSREFYVIRGSGLASYIYYVSVSAVPVSGGSIPQDIKVYLREQVSEKTVVILLGSQEDFPAEVIQWIAANYKINTVPRREGESVSDWVLRACGVQSSPVVTPTMAAGGVTSDLTIPFIEKTRALSMLKAQNFYKALVNGLDFSISFVRETPVVSTLGLGFKGEILIAGGFALFLMFALLYIAFSRIKVVLAILIFVFVDAILSLAGISIFNLTFGLPAIAGVLFVVFAGLNQHIIITNELLKGVQPQEGASVGWRTSRALSISYLATFTTILVSALMALLGFGSIRIFAITAAVGMTIAILLTRPVFARMVESVLSARPKMAVSGSAAKPEQKQQ